MMLPKPNEVWRHTRTGKRYKIIALARSVSSQELHVVYAPVGGGEVWVRSLSGFMAFAAEKTPRFTKEAEEGGLT